MDYEKGYVGAVVTKDVSDYAVVGGSLGYSKINNSKNSTLNRLFVIQ